MTEDGPVVLGVVFEYVLWWARSGLDNSRHLLICRYSYFSVPFGMHFEIDLREPDSSIVWRWCSVMFTVLERRYYSGKRWRRLWCDMGLPAIHMCNITYLPRGWCIYVHEVICGCWYIGFSFTNNMRLLLLASGAFIMQRLIWNILFLFFEEIRHHLLLFTAAVVHFSWRFAG